MRELRHEYIRAIQEEEQRTATLREKYVKHKGIVEEEVRADVEEAFGELAEWAKEAAKADIGGGPRMISRPPTWAAIPNEGLRKKTRKLGMGRGNEEGGASLP